MHRLEAARDDYKLRCEVVEQELLESQNKIEELSTLAEESRYGVVSDGLKCWDQWMCWLKSYACVTWCGLPLMSASRT